MPFRPLVFAQVCFICSDTKPGSTNPNDGMAARLNAGETDKRIGTAIMLRVNRGDKFKISADAFFADSYVQEDDVSTSDVLEGLMGALLGGGTYGGIPTSELPQNTQLIQNAFSNPQLLTQLEEIVGINNNVNAPKAHLNVLFFDEGMQFIAENSGSVQVPSSTTGFTNIDPSTVMDASVLVPGGFITTLNPGFMIVYVDNQSIGKDVWFDNIAVGHYTSDVIEEDHYYPFGLTITTDAGGLTTGQPYKYQGIELEKHFGLEMYETFYRIHDPQLGIFRQIDPKAELDYSLSPFVAMRNNPAFYTDPLGDVVRVGEGHREQMDGILKTSFGDNASKFSYSDKGDLKFNGSKKDLSKEERKAFNNLDKLMGKKEVTNVVFAEKYTVELKTGNKEINTGNDGSKGDAAVYADVTKSGESYIIVNPNNTSSNVIEISETSYSVDKDGNPANATEKGSITKYKTNIVGQSTQTYTPYENFWHGVGHIIGGPGNEYRAIDTENDAARIHRPSPLPTKKYNVDHPPRHAEVGTK